MVGSGPRIRSVKARTCLLSENAVVGVTWLAETAERHRDRVAHDLLGRQEYVRVPVSCPVNGCGWVAGQGSEQMSLADHFARDHPVGIPRLLIGGEPARAVQVFKQMPEPGAFTVVGGHMDFRRSDRPWRLASGPDDLVGEMQASSRASDWTIRVRAAGHEDLTISYRIRVRVITDDQIAAIDESFLSTFSRAEVSVGDVLAFRARWSREVVEEEYAGCLADAMQYLVLRGTDRPESRSADSGPVVRRLASYSESVVSLMLSDTLRFCDLDIAESASQDLTPTLSLGLDLLNALATNQLPPPPHQWSLPAGGTEGLYVDEATADLLDRVSGLMLADTERARGLASDLVAWGDMGGRRAPDRDKALAFAIFSSASHGQRESTREWVSQLVHHPSLGEWARRVRDGEAPR